MKIAFFLLLTMAIFYLTCTISSTSARAVNKRNGFLAKKRLRRMMKITFWKICQKYLFINSTTRLFAINCTETRKPIQCGKCRALWKKKSVTSSFTLSG